MIIPIIGQPRVDDWAFSVVVTCAAPCGTTFLWQGRPGARGPGTVVACPACRKRYTLTRMPTFDPNGQAVMPIAWQPPEAPV